MRQLLIVEPDRQFASLITDSLAGGVESTVVRNAQEAIDWLDVPERTCDLVISELALGMHSGVEIIHELRSHADWLTLPVIIYSRLARPKNLMNDVLNEEYGVIAYLEKGRDSLMVLAEAVRKATHEAVHD